MRWWRPRRRSARVVLLDPAGRVLLLHQAVPGGAAEGPYWYLPGGGILPFEKTEAAARRELREETGIRDAVIGPVIGERADVTFRFRGRLVIQDEWYVAGWAPSDHVGSGRLGDGERRAVSSHRWWSPDDLATSREPVFPPELPDLLRAAAAWVGGASG